MGALRSGELAGTQCTPLLEHLHRRALIRYLGGHPPHPQPVLILHRAGDRPRPPRRGHRGDGLLALGPPRRLSLTMRAPHNRIRPASSPRYTDPSSSPIAISAAASSLVGRIRVRSRTPAGAAATTGPPIRRSDRPSAMPHILAATTDTTTDRRTDTAH